MSTLTVNKKSYNRFLMINVFFKESNYFPFYNDIIEENKYYEKKFPNSKFFFQLKGQKLYPIKIDNLPDNAYVSIAVPLENIRNLLIDDEYKKAIEWISDGNYRGKLRVSIHGYSLGMLLLSSNNYIYADQFILWMIANGLQKNIGINNQTSIQKKGLVTISLSACLTACYEAKKGFYNDRLKSFQSAEQSSIDRMIKCLSQHGYSGIQITGSSETIVSSDGKMYRLVPSIPTYTNIEYNSFHYFFKDKKNLKLLFEEKIELGKVRYLLPLNWHATTTNAKETIILIPDIYKIAPYKKNSVQDPDGVWVLYHNKKNTRYFATVIIPEGWSLNLIRRIIQPPMGWKAYKEADGRNYVESNQIAIASDVAGYGYKEALTHSDAKIRQYS